MIALEEGLAAMEARANGRTDQQLRPLRITPVTNKFAAGSVLIELGDTRINCTVSVDDGVPFFVRNSSNAQGWLTAEYSMLPGATPTRSRRERNFLSGRTQEIQRLIGRSLRGVIDLSKCSDLTLTIDCDVLLADGGTRTAAITGAYAALKIAVTRLWRRGRIKQNPLTDAVAAVSIGVRGDRLLCDLDYREDAAVDLDMNMVMTPSGGILEIQGTAERAALRKERLLDIIDLAAVALQPVFAEQQAAVEHALAAVPN